MILNQLRQMVNRQRGAPIWGVPANRQGPLIFFVLKIVSEATPGVALPMAVVVSRAHFSLTIDGCCCSACYRLMLEGR
jgi:hypothetical protein